MMIAKKALELLNDVEFSEKHQGVQEYTEMLIVCKEALEKQIPKQPKYEDVDNVYGAIKRTCTACGDVCMVSKGAKPYEHYCRHCGQALDWSENNV